MTQREYDHRKAAEECSELATVLIQHLNKPHKSLTKQIIEELGDVMYRVDKLKGYYDNDLLTKRILSKVTKEEIKEEKKKRK